MGSLWLRGLYHISYPWNETNLYTFSKFELYPTHRKHKLMNGWTVIHSSSRWWAMVPCYARASMRSSDQRGKSKSVSGGGAVAWVLGHWRQRTTELWSLPRKPLRQFAAAAVTINIGADEGKQFGKCLVILINTSGDNVVWLGTTGKCNSERD